MLLNDKLVEICRLAFAIFATGYQLASARGDAALKAYQLEAAEARAEQGRKDYARLVAAMDAVAASRSELDSARADAYRMRNAFDRRQRRAEALAIEPNSADLAKCTELLRESTELLSEGRELAIRSAAKADAVISIYK